MTKQDEFSFISLYRALAATLVMWDHLVGFWLSNYKIHWAPNRFIEQYVTDPMQIMHHFGFFAVVLFFLISGFIITHIAQRETRGEFIIKRIFRIYPPLIVYCILSYAIFSVLNQILNVQAYFTTFSFQDIVENALLINFFQDVQVVPLGVTWTLIIEVVFYALCAILFKPLQNRPVVTMSTLSLFCLVITWSPFGFGNAYANFAITVSYVPYLLFGQCLYYFYSKRISGYTFTFFTIANYFVVVSTGLKIHGELSGPNSLFIVSFFYAYALFVIGLLTNHKIKNGRIINFLATISYSVYLIHDHVGAFILDQLHRHIGYTVSLVIAVAVVILLSYLSYRFVEGPARKAARWIIQSGRTRRGTAVTHNE